MPADNSLLTWDQVHDPIDLSVQLFFSFFLAEFGDTWLGTYPSR